MPNLVKIGQNAAEIWQFSILRDGGRRHLGVFKFLTVRRLKRAELRRRAKFGQNWSNRVRDMAIFRFFQMAAAAILDFSNFKFFNGRTTEEGRTASFCQIWSKSVKTRPRYGDFSLFYKMAAGAILDFSNF